MTIQINLIVILGCWCDERGENDTRDNLGLWWLPLDTSLTIYAEKLSLFHLFANLPVPLVNDFSLRCIKFKFCLWLQTTGLFHLMHNVFVVINSVKSLRQTAYARGFGVVEMHEGLDHLRSIVVVPDSASGVCTKTNAGENTLVGPTRVVTTINFVAHGFDSAKNKKHAVLATFSFPEAVIVLVSAKLKIYWRWAKGSWSLGTRVVRNNLVARVLWIFYQPGVVSLTKKSEDSKYEIGCEGDLSTLL